jgi:predicted aldo/keto reductase-like oxidoreductase
MDRREFLRNAGCTAGIAGSAGFLAALAPKRQMEELTGRTVGPGGPQRSTTQSAEAAAQTRSGDMIYRLLGRTGERVSAIGLGGFHLLAQPDEDGAIQLVRSAIDRGLTFMDNSWDYGEGESEKRLGKALRDGYRERVFLMTKIDGRTRAAAAQQIDESLRRLQTDHLDLLQLHEVIRLEDPDRAFAEGGAMEALDMARQSGKTRYIGFTGHKDPTVHLRMLELARQHGFAFDTVQMPLNVMDAHFRSFGVHVLPILVRDGIGVLGMKPMGSGHILRSGVVKPIECLHYALTLPTSVVITGVENTRDLDQAFEAARTFRPLNPEEIASLLARTEEVAATGQFEPFKTSDMFDSTAHNPKWLG